jgi:hypothetical protein
VNYIPRARHRAAVLLKKAVERDVIDRTPCSIALLPVPKGSTAYSRWRYVIIGICFHRRLKARTAIEGISISDYILREVGKALERPTRREGLDGLRARPVRHLKPSATAFAISAGS